MKKELSFNPYFTGSNSGSVQVSIRTSSATWVSILILLEVILEAPSFISFLEYMLSFNPYFTGSNSGSKSWITVSLNGVSFNPYFTGSNSGSLIQLILVNTHHCFNPYFTGSNSGSFWMRKMRSNDMWVSILILLEVILEDSLFYLTLWIDTKFQSLFYWK